MKNAYKKALADHARMIEEETPTRYDFTESEASREQRENPAAASLLERYTEQLNNMLPGDIPAPTNSQFESQLRQIAGMIRDPSFGEPANDLGALQEFYNREIGDSYLNWTTKERRKIKARFNSMRSAQRQQLAAKDAIIEQLRERLDRAKRGS